MSVQFPPCSEVGHVLLFGGGGGGGVGGGYDEQLLPTLSCFAVTLSGQQPYIVPLHPPTG